MRKADRSDEGGAGKSDKPDQPTHDLSKRNPATLPTTAQHGADHEPQQGRRPAGGLEDLRRKVYAGQPQAEQAYRDSRQRAQLAASLKRQRRQAGLTLRAIACVAGWHPSFVSRLESATGPWPRIETIQRYLSACGTDARLGLMIAQPETGAYRIDSATTISDGREAIFEVM